MTAQPLQTGLPPCTESSLFEVHQARIRLDDDLTYARISRADREVLEADARLQFARDNRATNGYAGAHVATLDDYLESSFQHHERRLRVIAAIKARREALVAKGGF